MAFEKIFNEEAKSWGVIGKDQEGNDFGIGLGETLEIAMERLRAWVLYSLEVAAKKGIDGAQWLAAKPGKDTLEFSGADLSPMRRQLRLARGQEVEGASRRTGGGRRQGETRRSTEGRREGEVLAIEEGQERRERGLEVEVGEDKGQEQNY
jgi:hypothetical protein